MKARSGKGRKVECCNVVRMESSACSTNFLSMSSVCLFVHGQQITSSDHKPIHAAFSVKLTPEVRFGRSRQAIKSNPLWQCCMPWKAWILIPFGMVCSSCTVFFSELVLSDLRNHIKLVLYITMYIFSWLCTRVFFRGGGFLLLGHYVLNRLRYPNLTLKLIRS